MHRPQFVFFVLLIIHAHAVFGQHHEKFIKAGRLYDSKTNTLLGKKGIHIKGNRIYALVDIDDVPAEVEVIDLSNYTVLPGLIDAHTHVLFSQKADEDFTERSIVTLLMENDALRVLRGAKRAKSYLDVGITSIKDLGNSGMYLDIDLRDAINEGTIAGPRIFASGPILAARGGQLYGVKHDQQNIVGLEYRIIDNESDAKNAVRESVNQNVDLIKICADNIPNNTSLTKEEIKSIVSTAHDYGLKVTAHSITNESAWNAVEAGVDGIEHGFFLADSTLSLMAQKKVFLVPTENSRSYMLRYNKLAGYDEGDTDWIDNYMDNMKKRLSKAADFGVRIVAGSDNYTDMGYSRGKSSQDMFRAYFESEMKPLDILQSATFYSARFMDMENEIGVIQPNALADIIAVEGDLEDDFVETIQRVEFVMKDGKTYLSAIDHKGP